MTEKPPNQPKDNEGVASRDAVTANQEPTAPATPGIGGEPAIPGVSSERLTQLEVLRVRQEKAETEAARVEAAKREAAPREAVEESIEELLRKQTEKRNIAADAREPKRGLEVIRATLKQSDEDTASKQGGVRESARAKLAKARAQAAANQAGRVEAAIKAVDAAAHTPELAKIAEQQIVDVNIAAKQTVKAAKAATVKPAAKVKRQPAPPPLPKPRLESTLTSAKKPQTAMAAAFENAHSLRGKIKRRPAEALRKKRREEKQENEAFDARAIQTMEGEGGRTAEDIETKASIDDRISGPDTYSEPAENAYRKLAKIVRDIGVKPEDLNAEVWKGANAALDKVEKLTKLRVAESDSEKARRLGEQIRQLTASLFSKKMQESITRAAQKTLESRGTTAREPFFSHVASSGEPITPDQQLVPALEPPPAQPTGAEAAAPADAKPKEDGASPITVGEITLEEGEPGPVLGWGPREGISSPAPEPEQPPAATAAQEAKLGMPRPSADETKRRQEELYEHYTKLQREREAEAAAPVTEPEPEEWKPQDTDAIAARMRKDVENAVSNAPIPRPHERKDLYKRYTKLQREREAEAAQELEKPTPAESRGILKSLIDKYSWYKSSEEKLIRRNQELDAQLEKIGGKLKIERGFRWIGEKYNKLGWKSKLAIGAALGVGAVATAGTLAVAFPLLGLAVQRAAGLSTMYLKFEKQSHDEAWGKNKEWGKQKAFLKAGIYTVLMGIAIKEAIEYASGTELAHTAQAKVEGWLGSMLGHYTSTATTSPAETATPPMAIPPAGTGETSRAAERILDSIEAQKSIPDDVAFADRLPTPAEIPAWPESGVDTVGTSLPPTAPETPASIPDDVAFGTEGMPQAAPEAPPPAPVAETASSFPVESPPTAMVSATPGKGYEWMAKRLWEELQSQNLDPTQYPEGSDVRKLLEADPSKIDGLVHKLATEHEFYKPDGSSAPISLGSHLFINTDGKLQLDDIVNARPGGPTTPPFPQPSIPTQGAPLSSPVFPGDHFFDQPPKPETPSPTSTVPSWEGPTARESPLPSWAEQPPAPVEEVKIPLDTAWKTEAGEPLKTADGTVVTTTAEAGASTTPAAEQTPGIVVNQFGLEVSPKVSHIYADPEGKLFVYGGLPIERANAILEYLTQNPDKIIYGADADGANRLPYFLGLDGKFTAGAPVEKSGFFARLFGGSQMDAPKPDEFAKIIK
ncbi:hypothetical protein HY415_00450 [Candidatus Kaiserbacteria bacterium]|nr:hypothetical protein [Candidatus Kaiserbacteria bacterium]